MSTDTESVMEECAKNCAERQQLEEHCLREFVFVLLRSVVKVVSCIDPLAIDSEFIFYQIRTVLAEGHQIVNRLVIWAKS